MIQIFIIFHKYIYDECYKNIPETILKEYFTFVAVNEKIQKEYTKDKYKVINEWELPIYNKSLQERDFRENSAIYHIYVNNLHKNYEFIGFFQYDMIFTEDIINILNMNKKMNIEYYPFEVYDFNNCTIHRGWNDIKLIEYIINDYEEYFKKEFSKNELYPLMNSYIISIETYDKIMPWIINLHDKIYFLSSQGIAGIFEAIMGFCIGNEKLKIGKYLIRSIKHDHNLKRNAY